MATLKDMVEANSYIERYISVLKERSTSEATIANDLAEIYSEANILDIAEEYYRQALLIEPENPVRLNALAYFLIDKERNINEGVELIELALKLSSENYNYLYTKGWGFYKQEKYKEALELLQKSWYLRKQYAEYYPKHSFISRKQKRLLPDILLNSKPGKAGTDHEFA